VILVMSWKGAVMDRAAPGSVPKVKREGERADKEIRLLQRVIIS
jgi:hypothetical protein